MNRKKALNCSKGLCALASMAISVDYIGEVLLRANSSKGDHVWRRAFLSTDDVGNVSTSRRVGQPDRLGVFIVADPLDTSTGIDNEPGTIQIQYSRSDKRLIYSI